MQKQYYVISRKKMIAYIYKAIFPLAFINLSYILKYWYNTEEDNRSQAGGLGAALSSTIF